MPLTRNFKEAVKARADRDPAFRLALLNEALSLFLEGDVETGKSVLRDYVNATIGFPRLGKLTGKAPASLMRMLSRSGNPTANNLFEVLSQLVRHEQVQLPALSPHRIRDKGENPATEYKEVACGCD